MGIIEVPEFQSSRVPKYVIYYNSKNFATLLLCNFATQKK